MLYYDRKKETFQQYKYNQEDPNTLTSDYITHLLKDSKNRLWIATKDGINMLDLNKSLENPKFLSFKYAIDNTVSNFYDGSLNVIYETNKGELLFGAGGLFRLKVGSDGQYYFQKDLSIKQHGFYGVTAIAEDQYNRLLVGTHTGIFLKKNTGKQNYERIFSGGPITNLIVDDKFQIWAGTDQGLLHFSNSKETENPKFLSRLQYKPEDAHSLSKNVITSLFIDKTGILWVGTNGGGVNKLDPNRKQFRHVQKTFQENSLSYDKIRSLFEDSNGTLWIGTEGGGLNKSLQTSKKYESFQSFDVLRRVFALEERFYDGKKYLLAGGQNPPYLFQTDISNLGNKENFMPLEGVGQSVFSLLNDSQNNLWIGTYSGGLYRWMLNDDGTFTKKRFFWRPNKPEGLSNNIVRNILEDSKGNIWIATGDGLCVLEVTKRYKEHPKFKVFKHQAGEQHSLSHDYILALYESKNGDMWVGTFGGGLNKLTKNADNGQISFEHFGVKDGLPNNVIKGILEDDQGFLWISTNKGLSRLIPRIKSSKILTWPTVCKTASFKNWPVSSVQMASLFSVG